MIRTTRRGIGCHDRGLTTLLVVESFRLLHLDVKVLLKITFHRIHATAKCRIPQEAQLDECRRKPGLTTLLVVHIDVVGQAPTPRAEAMLIRPPMGQG